MGIDLTTLLAGLTGGAQGMSTAVQQDDARKRQLALDAMNVAAHQATMDKIKADAARQQGEDYLKGIRQGQAPSGGPFQQAGQLAGSLADAATPTGVPLARPTLPSPYEQINATSYVDRTQTPEAVAQRTATATEDRKHAQTLADEDRRVQAMIGAKLPDGTVVDERIARAMVASPSLGSAYARPPQPEPRDHYTVSNAVDAQGHPIVINTATGEEHSSTGTKPQSATHNAEAQKEQKRVELMQQGYETMKANAQGIRQNAIAMAIHHPSAANVLLTRQEQNYLLGLRNFIAGEMHAESGARLSQEQLAFGFQRYGPQFFDKNATEKLNEARRALEGSQRAFGGSQSPAPDVRQDTPVRRNIFLSPE